MLQITIAGSVGTVDLLAMQQVDADSSIVLVDLGEHHIDRYVTWRVLQDSDGANHAFHGSYHSRRLLATKSFEARTNDYTIWAPAA